jgi:hypothetical protein
VPRTSTFSNTPISQLLNRQPAAITTSKASSTVHGQAGIPPVMPVGWNGFGPLPLVPPGGEAPGDALGECVPPIVPGDDDEVEEGEGKGDRDGGGDAFGVGFGLGDGLRAGGGIDALIV